MEPLWGNFCVWCEIGVQLHTFACGYPVVAVLFVERTVLFPPTCWKPMTICVCLFLGFQFYSIDSHVYLNASTILLSFSFLWVYWEDHLGRPLVYPVLSSSPTILNPCCYLVYITTFEDKWIKWSSLIYRWENQGSVRLWGAQGHCAGRWQSWTHNLSFQLQSSLLDSHWCDFEDMLFDPFK